MYCCLTSPSIFSKLFISLFFSEDCDLDLRAAPSDDITATTLVVVSLQLKSVKLQLHVAIYWLRFYSNSLIHILSLSNSNNDVASIQKNRGDKSHRVIVALVSSH